MNQIPTPNLIDITTSKDIEIGRYPVYAIGIGVSMDDLTDMEKKLLEGCEWTSTH